MGFLEETVVKAKDVFDVAAKKTNEVIGIQKLKINASKVNSQMAKDFETLGRIVFEKVENDNEIDESYKPIVESIKEKLAELDKIEEEIDEQKKTKTCPKCGVKNPDSSAYCSVCGEKLD